MSLYSEPPSLREFKYDKPTLLVCWWATALCTCTIFFRVTGRFIRTERLFKSDRISALALVPLYLRMACVHYILLYGTNNSDFDGVHLSEEEINRKQVASGLVLLSRISYAATLWILKYTTLEFFRRLTDVTWERSYERTLILIRWALIVTFGAVCISTLAECQPFSHYWQVMPNPGGQCRQAYAQLLTMAVCNILTDLLIVFFPIPIILRSHMKVKRKIQLCLLFSLSLSVVGVTLYRVPHIIAEDGRQQYRSLLASVELIFATGSANALVLGSFVRDRGAKKKKYRRDSAADSFDRVSNHRRPTLHRHWGSDEDLVRDVGMGVDPELQERPQSSGTNPMPIAKNISDDLLRWEFPQHNQSQEGRSDEFIFSQEAIGKIDSNIPQRRVSFFDVGGLLSEEGETSSARKASVDHKQPSPSLTAGSNGFRRGSSTLLQDLGGLLSPLHTSSRFRGKDLELQPIPQSQDEQTYTPHGKPSPILKDPGGLLRS
ncbi:unnamed protein product [Clonostachys chloroleuca]|uniref:Rhodopsin domain-containing protein n=1 Tax=Clonostachys chloroleuca TaxID=1926264 RepID=A0AA35Q348_9HYPO|nr:unnamed protein product [Clonostachys chloroleuca]